MMGFPELSLVIDLAGVALLVAVIFYAVRLNRHLTALQKSKEELEQLLAGFVGATEVAEGAIDKVKEAATQNAGNLNELVKKAEILREDLNFMIDRGSRVADSLEGGISRNRNDAGAGNSAPTQPSGGAVAPRPQTAIADPELDSLMQHARDLADAPSKSLSAAAEDRPAVTSSEKSVVRAAGSALATTGDGTAEGQVAGSKPKSGKKTKTALLKALQGMR